MLEELSMKFVGNIPGKDLELFIVANHEFLLADMRTIVDDWINRCFFEESD